MGLETLRRFGAKPSVSGANCLGLIIGAPKGFDLDYELAAQIEILRRLSPRQRALNEENRRFQLAIRELHRFFGNQILQSPKRMILDAF